MTIGHITTGSLNSPYFFDKNWSGLNGPVETVNAKVRDKWNDYTVERFEQRLAAPLGFWPNIQIEPNYGWTSTHDASLQGKLVSAVREHDFNLAVNVAQGVQTANMVVSNLQRLGRSFLALKHGDPATAMRQLGTGARTRPLRSTDVPGRWLEMQYGWLPLVGDTYEAVKAYHVLTQAPRTSTVKVRKTKSGTYQASASQANYLAPGNYKYRKQIIYEMTESLTAARSLGLADPASVVWEILPYSFVVDWFIPIGTYLDNLSIIPKLNGRFLTSTHQSTKAAINWTLTGFSYAGVKGVATRNRVSRIKSTGLTTSFPSFVSIPQAMSGRRILNAIALTSQIFLS